MDQSFIRGFQVGIRKPPVVFRQQLKPLTLGHLFLLEAIESPIIGSGQDNPTFADVGAAVFACAHDHEVSRRKFTSWFFPIFVRIWALFASADWVTRDWPIFRDYLEDGLASPSLRPVKTDEGQTGVCRAPAPWIKLLFAMHILGMSRAEALACEVVELNVLYATWAEWNGRAEIADVDAIQGLWEFAAQEDAKRFNPDGTKKDDNSLN